MVRAMWLSCCFFVLVVLMLIGEIVTQHRTAVIIVFAVSSVVLFYAVVRSAIAYGDERGTGLIKNEKELLEDDEIYETMGVVKLGIYDGSVVILRLRNGELRGCRMGEVPPERVFKVKSRSGKIDKYGYPSESLKGRIIDIQV